jgi:tRNA threonylcarbamoyladenosine biosynthesis protein TsaE
MKRVSKNLEDTKDIARDIVKVISPKNNARVIGLYGDLGAGKTAFAQSLAEHLGVKNKVVSPTFVIMKKYDIAGKAFEKLIHIDAYRLEKWEELAKLGWADIISDPKNLVLIEWPEKVADIMPDGHFKIKIKHLDQNSREFDICP